MGRGRKKQELVIKPAREDSYLYITGTDCCVPGCVSSRRTKTSPDFTFHFLPNEPELRRRWLSNIWGMDKQFITFPPGKKVIVCCEHFTKEDMNLNPVRNTLKKFAVPTVFPAKSTPPPFPSLEKVAFIESPDARANDSLEMDPWVKNLPGDSPEEKFWAFSRTLLHKGLLCDIRLQAKALDDSIQDVYAHKLLLSFYSRYFYNIFNRNDIPSSTESVPTLFMPGLSFEGLTNILAFIYGENSIESVVLNNEALLVAKAIGLETHSHDSSVMLTRAWKNVECNTLYTNKFGTDNTTEVTSKESNPVEAFVSDKQDQTKMISGSTKRKSNVVLEQGASKVSCISDSAGGSELARYLSQNTESLPQSSEMSQSAVAIPGSSMDSLTPTIKMEPHDPDYESSSENSDKGELSDEDENDEEDEEGDVASEGKCQNRTTFIVKSEHSDGEETVMRKVVDSPVVNKDDNAMPLADAAWQRLCAKTNMSKAILRRRHIQDSQAIRPANKTDRTGCSDQTILSATSSGDPHVFSEEERSYVLSLLREGKSMPHIAQLTQVPIERQKIWWSWYQSQGACQDQQYLGAKAMLRNKYTVQYKLIALRYLKQGHSVADTAKQFNVCTKRIRDWQKQEQKLVQVEKSGLHMRQRLKGGGRKPRQTKLEEKLVSWVNTMQSQNVKLSVSDVRRHAQTIYSTEDVSDGSSQEEFRASKTWANKFLTRHGLSLKKLHVSTGENEGRDVQSHSKDDDLEDRSRTEYGQVQKLTEEHDTHLVNDVAIGTEESISAVCHSVPPAVMAEQQAPSVGGHLQQVCASEASHVTEGYTSPETDLTDKI